jgi:hypothetical protein
MARVEANNDARQRLEYLQTRSRCFCNSLDAINGDSSFHDTRDNCPYSGATVSRYKLVHSDIREIAYSNVVRRRIPLSGSRPRVSLRNRNGYIIFKLSSSAPAHPFAEFRQKDRLQKFA